MFTGIIEEKAVVTKIDKAPKAWTFTVATKSILKGKKKGQSIAINGACMTITKITSKSFEFQTIPESLEKTNLRQLTKGSRVNLEPAMKLGQEIDGHIVQGHVDCTATVSSLKTIKDHVRLTLKIPKQIREYLAIKGSVSINGVSLTISRLTKTEFATDLIPLTLKVTNLSSLEKGDKVNIEVDLMARYIKQLLNGNK